MTPSAADQFGPVWSPEHPASTPSFLKNATNCEKKAKVSSGKADIGIKERRSLTHAQRFVKLMTIARAADSHGWLKEIIDANFR